MSFKVTRSWVVPGAVGTVRREIGTIEGQPLSVTAMSFPSDLDFGLGFDFQGTLVPIVTNDGGFVRMPETIKLWQRKPGRAFGDYLSNCPTGSIAVVPSQYLWEREAFLIFRDRDRIRARVDAEVEGRFEVFGFSDEEEGWVLRSVYVEERTVHGADDLIGWNGPILRRDGEGTPLEDIAAARCADPRNFVNFGAGPEVNNLIGSFLPSDPDSARRLIRGEAVEGPWVSDTDPALPTQLQRAFNAAGTGHLIEVQPAGEMCRIVIHGQLELNRIPVTVVGCNEAGELRVVVLDGRQPEVSVGATLPEILEICRERELHTAVMGGAGSDATVAMRVRDAHDVNAGEGVEILNFGFNVRPACVCLTISELG